MSQTSPTPFDTIESAHDFVRVLGETIAEAKQEIELDLARELDSPPSRHRDALRIALYNLEKLEKHTACSRRLLNDLRSLRRLLFAERRFVHVKSLRAPTGELAPEIVPAIIAAIPAPEPVGRVMLSVKNAYVAPPA